jgi:hypothetical protein
MIGRSTRLIGYEGLSYQAVFHISCNLKRLWRPQSITWILALWHYGILGKRDGIATVFLVGSISTICYEFLTVHAMG